MTPSLSSSRMLISLRLTATSLSIRVNVLQLAGSKCSTIRVMIVESQVARAVAVDSYM